MWRLALSTGLSHEFIASGSVRAPGSATAPTVPMAFEDVQHEPLLVNRRESLARQGIRSMLAIPLTMHDRTAGTVVFYWREFPRPRPAP